MSFRLITIALLMALSSNAYAGGPLFNPPTAEGVIVATCAAPGAQCGKPAADLFCKKNNYSAASKFTYSRTKGQAIFISTLLPCLGQCERFAAITCSINVTAGSSTDIGSTGN